MDHAEAFLQAITDDPADDAPRLIFADWLEEQGDDASRSRAEFIRVQYALRDLGPDDPYRMQLEERQRDLLLAHEAEWLALLRDLGVVSCQFRRGFVEQVSLTPQALVQHGAAICARTPLRDLRLLPWGWGQRPSEVDGILPRLAGAAWLEGIETLDLSQIHLEEAPLRALLHSPRLAKLSGLAIQPDAVACAVISRAPFVSGLKALSLTGYNVDTASATELFRSEVLTSLTRLDVIGQRVTQSVLSALASAPPPHLESLSLVNGGPIVRSIFAPLARVRITTLRRLDLRSNLLDQTIARSLAEAPLLDTVEELDLGTNNLGDEGISWLVESPHLPELRRLHLNSNLLGPAACRALAAKSPPHLRSLHLRTNRIGDEGLRILARSPELSGLTALHVGYNRITSLGALELAEAFPPNLTVLDLSWNRVGDTGVGALASAAGAKQLAALDLSYCELGDEAARGLASSGALANLHTLNLGTNRIGDRGLAALAESPHLTRLAALNLGNNNISDAGVQALLASQLLSRLVALHLLGTPISPEQRRRLRKEFRGILG